MEDDSSSSSSGSDSGDDESSDEEVNVDEDNNDQAGSGNDSEDGEDDEEDDEDPDLFGKNNEDYMKTTAVSALRPPTLPASSFPRKQDFRDAGGRRGPPERGGPGGRGMRGVGGGGGGGMGGDGSGSLLPWNQFSTFGGPSGRGGRPSEALVADMKLGATGHNNDMYRVKCPPFQEPSHIAGFSRSADGSVQFDESCLRRFRREILQESGLDLNEGFDTYVEKKEDGAGSGFGDLLACLRDKQVPLDNIHFVTYRNNLNKILGTAYNRQDVWEMGVHKRQGTVYLDVHKLPEAPHLDVTMQKRRSYWGYSFERFATEAPSSRQVNGTARKPKNAVNANVEFCAIVKTKLGPHRIIMGAEMDCYDTASDGRKYFVELKTSRALDARTVDRFERDKLLKFWIQSFLAGVQRILVGYRDDAGRLLGTEMMRPQDITHRVKQKHHWEGGVCLAFADQVLCWLYGSVKEGEDYTLRFNRHANRLELVKANSCPDTISSHMDLLAGTATR